MFSAILDFLNHIVQHIGGYGGLTGIIGGLTGIIALLQTRHSGKIAEKANSLSEKANSLSKESNEAVRSSNEIARIANVRSGNANKLAVEANKLSIQSLSIASDQIEYKWVLKFGFKNKSFVLCNETTSVARDVVLLFFVHLGGRPWTVHYEAVKAAYQIECKSPRFDKLVTNLLAQASKERETKFKSIHCTALIGWTTQYGVHRNSRIDLRVRFAFLPDGSTVKVKKSKRIS